MTITTFKVLCNKIGPLVSLVSQVETATDRPELEKCGDIVHFIYKKCDSTDCVRLRLRCSISPGPALWMVFDLASKGKKLRFLPSAPHLWPQQYTQALRKRKHMWLSADLFLCVCTSFSSALSGLLDKNGGKQDERQDKRQWGFFFLHFFCQGD